MLILLGLSIDYVLHIAIAFQRAPRALGAYRRTHGAVDELGQSVAQAALTTAFAASFMIPLELRPFSRFGIYSTLIAFLNTYCALTSY